MTCGGCSGAVGRVLEKAKVEGGECSVLAIADLTPLLGVSEYEVSLEKQEVLVTGTLPYEDVLGRIKKTGKEASHAVSSSHGRAAHNIFGRFDRASSSTRHSTRNQISWIYGFDLSQSSTR